MIRKPIYVSIFVLGLISTLALRAGLAQDLPEPAERDQPQSTLAVEALVSSKFSYQGVLNEDGVPVSGTRDMVFTLCSDAGCTLPVGGTISMPAVPVTEGLFSVELSIASNQFYGRGLWLRIVIEGVTVGCQEIMPVPYALSLRPGARIEGDQANWDALHAVNLATSGQSYGIYGRSNSTDGRGVYAYGSAGSGLVYGLYARSNSAEGAGVYARGVDDGPDIILGGNADTTYGDDGRIISDPGYASSDIHLITNDGLRIDLDEDISGEDADFEIRSGNNTLIFNVDESGVVTFGGPGITSFPRPAYDSGWVSLGQGASSTRTHNLGGNVDDYVVDLTCKDTSKGINNWGVGGDANGSEFYGGWWSHLTTTAITIHRWDDDTDCDSARVRIWVYP